MTNFEKTVHVPIIGETAFSQYRRALLVKFRRTIRLNPELSMGIMAEVEGCTPYRSPKKKSYTTNMLREKSPRSSDSFNAATGTLPALCNPVVVEGHTWCSIRSVSFKVWVRGAGPIDIDTKNGDLVASGTLYPVEDMAAVYAMIQKGAQLAREKLISLSQKHDPHIDIEAMRAPLFILRSDAIITKIAGAMSATAHRRYMAWYKEHHTPEAAKMASDAMLIASDAAQAARFDSNEGPAFHMSLQPRTKCASCGQSQATTSQVAESPESLLKMCFHRQSISVSHPLELDKTIASETLQSGPGRIPAVQQDIQPKTISLSPNGDATGPWGDDGIIEEERDDPYNGFFDVHDPLASNGSSQLPRPSLARRSRNTVIAIRQRLSAKALPDRPTPPADLDDRKWWKLRRAREKKHNALPPKVVEVSAIRAFQRYVAYKPRRKFKQPTVIVPPALWVYYRKLHQGREGHCPTRPHRTLSPFMTHQIRIRSKELTGVRPYIGKFGNDDVDGIDTAYRIVADHVWTLSFAPSDGGVLNNVDCGYVLRRDSCYVRKKLGAPIGSFPPHLSLMAEAGWYGTERKKFPPPPYYLPLRLNFRFRILSQKHPHRMISISTSQAFSSGHPESSPPGQPIDHLFIPPLHIPPSS
ncbi:hypothetical protein EDB19DRAFT_1908675 [Suillus lakei]|nr:hypothetical protein EDB19DRAFT_1908675 [Suillus lakei]